MREAIHTLGPVIGVGEVLSTHVDIIEISYENMLGATVIHSKFELSRADALRLARAIFNLTDTEYE